MAQITHDDEFVRPMDGWLPSVRSIPSDRPWVWLSAGWRDMTASPMISFGYGLLAVISSFMLLAGLAMMDMHYLILPLAGGFMLLGPIFAVGLYESSRVQENHRQPTLSGVINAYHRNAAQLGVIGMSLLIVFFAWVRLAFLLFMLFFSENPPALDMLVEKIFFSSVTPMFLAVGTVAGFIMAATVFAISVVAIPMLLDRDSDAFSAMAVSIKACRENPRTMAIWAGLIALFISAGIATGFLGLLITFPLIGHASWHAYRDIVERDGQTGR
jgi:uncharacterized membrane protein